MTIDIHLGTFTYTTPEGHPVTEPFAIRTVDNDESRQCDDYNEQLTDKWESLTFARCSDIRYTKLEPVPAEYLAA